VTAVRPELLRLLVLRAAALLCFAGWAWQHVYWEGPYGVLLWQPSTYEFAEGVGADWDAFVGTAAGDGWVQRWVERMAWPFLVFPVLVCTVRRHSRWQMLVLLVGSLVLGVVAYAKYVGNLRELPMLLEHGSQVASPLLLVMALSLGTGHRAVVAVALAAFVATFAGHGAYALGLWPTPATFQGMTTVILGCEYDTTTAVLRIAGALDLLVCVGVLIPAVRVPCALYGVLWGLATALARPVAGMSTQLRYFGADQFVHEAVLRAPHFLIPLYLLLLWRRGGANGNEIIAPGDPSARESGPSSARSSVVAANP